MSFSIELLKNEFDSDIKFSIEMSLRINEL